MQFRHEIKFEINKIDRMILQKRLKAVMKSDKNAINGVYKIRSLYFDTLDDKALLEKINGDKQREKYRIRLYNNNFDVIKLERKYKTCSLGFKQSASLAKDEALMLSNGDYSFMKDSDDKFLHLFYTKAISEQLKPKVIVDYTREPFTFSAGNVRVTLDYDIRTSIKCTDLLNINCITVPINDNVSILEVKWDNFLPEVIYNIINLDCRKNGAFSKYASCRMYE